MKKIKSVRLAKDYRDCSIYIPIGTVGSQSVFNYWKFVNGFDNCFELYEDYIINNNTGLFDITYEENFFEVKPLEEGHGLDYTNVNIGEYINFSNTAIHNRFATRQEAEFENMRRETLHYFRELAKELNEGWEWDIRLKNQALAYDRISECLVLHDWDLTAYPQPKFRPSITIEQITERALPSMIENFIKICKSQY